jgi:hypothetical protein
MWYVIEFIVIKRERGINEAVQKVPSLEGVGLICIDLIINTPLPLSRGDLSPLLTSKTAAFIDLFRTQSL